MSMKNEINDNQAIVIQDKNVYIAFKKKNRPLSPKSPETKNIRNTSTLMTYCHQILSNANITNMSFQMIYSLCYKICFKKGEKYLSEQIKVLLSNYLKNIYENEISILYSDDIEYYKKIIELYNYFISKIIIIQKTLMYYETNYLKKHNHKDIKEEAKDLFFNVVISHYSGKITEFLLLMINNCRLKEKNNRSFVFQLMGMLIDLNQIFIIECLKDKFLSTQENYYKELYYSDVLSKEFPKGIIYINTFLIDEVNNIHQCNIGFLKTKLLEKFYRKIIEPWIFNNPSIEESLKPIIMSQNIDLLSITYSLSKINQGDLFLELLSKVIESIGKSIISKVKTSNDQMILNVINEILHLLHITNYISLHLKIDNQLYWESMIKDHFISFINSSNNLIAKILPKYIDIYFTQAINPVKAISIDFNLSSVNDAMDLFKFIKDKGLFELQYRKLLGYRLLTNVYQEYHERSILNKMMICGSMFIRKCETMLNDFKESNNYISKYNNARLFPVNINFQIKILTSGNWEIKKDEFIKHERMYLLNESFNAEFSHLKCIQLMNDYYKFYMKYHPNIVISQYLCIGNCEINAIINKKTYLISLSPIQSLFCMLFNKSNYLRRVTVEELRNIFLIKTNERIIEIFKPLVMNNLFVLENNTYSFNRNYTNKGSKIIINLKNELAKLTIEEKEVTQILLKQRNIIIESLIIRIMKAKQKITHIELVNELPQINLNFVPDVAMIKNRIEILIERGYISRDINELNTYLYIA